jgi:Zn/Cd-binding protein ZinT
MIKHLPKTMCMLFVLLAFSSLKIHGQESAGIKEVVDVENLAALRTQTADNSTVYRVTGVVILTHQNGNRNQKYFQDDSGAILVDDAGGVITTAYKEYDAISGLTGKLSAYQNLLQLVPVEDPGPVVSSGNVVTPLELTLAQVNPSHQGQLVIIKDVSFGNPPSKENFAPSRNYNIYDASGTGVIRTPNAAARLDYFGAPVPEEPTDVIAVVNQFGTTMQLMPRKLADMGITDMPNIAALRNQAADNSTIYTLIGEVVMTHKNGNRNQKYFQDATGAILIDDSPGIITTSYNEYDGVTGLTGKLSAYAGMLQLIPTGDPGPATSTGRTVAPLLLQLADIKPEHQSMLVRVNEVTFATPANPNFAASTNYTLTDASGPGLIRTPNAAAGLDYFGTPVPTTERDIIAVVNQFNQTMQLMPRSLDDFISLDFYTVTFVITDESGGIIPGAVITLGDESYDPGEYILHDIPGGAYTFNIAMAGYWEESGTILVEEDISKEVMLIAVDEHLVTNFPMTEDFTGSFPPTGWKSISAGAAGGWQVGNNAAYHSFTPAGQHANSWLITPQIQLPGDKVMLLKFLERNQFMADYGYSGVWISEKSGLPQNGDFVELYESASGLASFTEKSISLRDYMGKVVYLAFVYQGDDAHNWWLDQVVIEQAPDVIEVPNLAALRAGATDGTKYRVTGNVILTHKNGNRNQKYVQDATAAILIDDAPGRITTSYNTYDAFSGLTGTLSVYAGLLQFLPDGDPGPATSSGNTVEPLELKLNEITPQHQAQLIVIRSVSFGTPPAKATFAASTNYNIFDDSGTGIMRTPNINAGLDYFGTEVPATPKDIIAVVNQFNQDMQIMPRSLADFMDPSTSVPPTNYLPEVKLYPNPAQSHFYLESAVMIEHLRIFSLNGQLLQQRSVYDYSTSVDASWLKNGLYIIQVVAAERVITHKLQIVR